MQLENCADALEQEAAGLEQVDSRRLLCLRRVLQVGGVVAGSQRRLQAWAAGWSQWRRPSACELTRWPGRRE
jgi:hypothetical protein